MNQQIPAPVPAARLTGDPSDSRKLGLEYALRQHPWATPTAEADGIVSADHSDAAVQLSRVDPVLSIVAAITKRISEPVQYGTYIVTTPGQYFIRPSILVNAVSNLCDGDIVICLAEGERLPGRKLFRAGLVANGLPYAAGKFYFNRALVVRQIFTTSGPVATASLLIGGTWANGQVYTAVISTPNPADPASSTPITVSLAYTTVVGDLNNAGAAASFAAAWNANPTLAALATASVPSGSTVLLTAIKPGSLIQQSILTTSATGTGTFAVSSPFAGALNPDASISFE
jgi:hypothetical protein